MNNASTIWNENEEQAELLIPLLGRLQRDKRITLKMFGRPLSGLTVVDILKLHKYTRHVLGTALNPSTTVQLARLVLELSASGHAIDIGELSQHPNPAAFFEHQSPVSGDRQPIILYGFGRIGRLVARILLANPSGPELKAIVVRKAADNDLEKRANLLRRDSVHGRFNGTITIDLELNQIIANGNAIQVIYSGDPSTVDYESFGIKNAIVIDNTGIWRDEIGLAKHLESKGVSRVLLTAPGKAPLKNIVFGVNDSDVLPADKIVSAASCTTNAITPVLKVVNDRFGVQFGHVETVHSYTNDQNLIDNFHKGDRRGRSAALNMVITETGAATAVAKALPALEGKLTGSSIRVPTPNVSLAILNLQLHNPTSVSELNQVLRTESISGLLRSQLDFTDSSEVVSSDFIGNDRSAIVDSLATIVNETRVVLYVWYDNESGYSHQVVRLARQMGEQLHAC